MGLTLAPQYTRRTYSWTNWKVAQSIRGLQTQYDDDGSTYLVYGYDGPEVHVTTIWKGDVPGGVLANYSQAQNDADKADFEASYKPNANRRLDLKTADGRLRTALEKSDGKKITLFSHDWTDPTTWTTQAVRVVDEVATDEGAHTVYDLAHVNIIDTYHGKVTGEDYMEDASGNSFRVVVKVNDVVKTEQDPHYGSGGDYTVNYATGKVTFLSARAAEDVVKVTYHYANGSEYVLKPQAGKILRISLVECQFSADVVVNDTVTFQAWGLVDVFAPQLMPGVPSGTLIPLDVPDRYKTITDFQNDALRSYPAYPALGGSSWRGSLQEIIIFDWDYLSETPLYAAYGMEIRIGLEHDVPFGGFYATATFYGMSEDA